MGGAFSKKVGCAILNYNAAPFTISCAESVLNGNLLPEWLVIVDNCSSDNSLAIFEDWKNGRKEENIVILPQEANKGYAGGNNAGIRWLQQVNADAVWILNNDTKADVFALEALVKRLYSKSRPGLCGSLVLYMDKPEVVQCRGGGKTNWMTFLSKQNGNGLTLAQALQDHANNIESQLNYIYGASVLVSKEFLEKVGLMDESLFLYCEEQDWALRGRKNFDLAYAPESLIWHKEGFTSQASYRGRTIKNAFRLLRSRLKVTWKHNPWFLPSVILASTFRLGQKFLSKMHSLI